MTEPRRRVAVFTSSRADFGPLGPVVQALDAEEKIELLVIATGTHVAESWGGRLEDIRLSPASRLEVLDAEMAGSRPTELGDTYGRIAAGVSRVLDACGVDILVMLGDRWELLAAAGPALIHGVPIAHLHGGETTEGAIDERIRHGITKLADLHLCATEDSARRIRQLGEEAWRIRVTGAPGLDRLNCVRSVSSERLEQLLGRPVSRPFGIIVYHPPTVDRDGIRERATMVYGAAAAMLGSGLILHPGADPGAAEVIEAIHDAVGRHDNLSDIQNLGDDYISVLKAADVLVGNSSSGIIEAASLSLPVVDVGDRQRGRLRPPNVIHVEETSAAIEEGLCRALSPAFRRVSADVSNPYGDGRASERIVDALLNAPLERLKRKPLIEDRSLDIPLDGLTVRPDATLREAMAVISRGRAQIVFVVDDHERLLGTLTDGDARRALLAGMGMEKEIAGIMNRIPIVVGPGALPRSVLDIMERNKVSQIPVVDSQGRLIGVHLLHSLLADALDTWVTSEQGRPPSVPRRNTG